VAGRKKALGNPPLIFDIGLAPRNGLDVLRVDDQKFETVTLQFPATT